MPIETAIFSILIGCIGATAILVDWFYEEGDAGVPRSDVTGPWLRWWDKNI